MPLRPRRWHQREKGSLLPGWMPSNTTWRNGRGCRRGRRRRGCPGDFRCDLSQLVDRLISDERLRLEAGKGSAPELFRDGRDERRLGTIDDHSKRERCGHGESAPVGPCVALLAHGCRPPALRSLRDAYSASYSAILVNSACHASYPPNHSPRSFRTGPCARPSPPRLSKYCSWRITEPP